MYLLSLPTLDVITLCVRCEQLAPSNFGCQRLNKHEAILVPAPDCLESRFSSMSGLEYLTDPSVTCDGRLPEKVPRPVWKQDARPRIQGYPRNNFREGNKGS